MAIRFACPSCQQPIEIDDQWANQSVGCPYCKHVVTAPGQSTWPAGSVSQASPAPPPASPATPQPFSSPEHSDRPGGLTPPPPPHGYPFPHPEPRKKSTAALLSLLFFGLQAVCTVVGFVIIVGGMMSTFEELGVMNAPQDELERAQFEYIVENGRFPGGNSTSTLFGVLGIGSGLAAMVLAVASFIRREPLVILSVFTLLFSFALTCCACFPAIAAVELPDHVLQEIERQYLDEGHSPSPADAPTEVTEEPL